MHFHTHVAKLSFYLKINAGIGGNIYFTHNGNPDWPVFLSKGIFRSFLAVE